MKTTQTFLGVNLPEVKFGPGHVVAAKTVSQTLC